MLIKSLQSTNLSQTVVGPAPEVRLGNLVLSGWDSKLPTAVSLLGTMRLCEVGLTYSQFQ